MQKNIYEFYDESRARTVLIAVYLPDTSFEPSNVVIFSPGYQGQESLKKDSLVYKNYNYLAEYFTKHNFAFISIQHDNIGDNDSLENINPNENQDLARRHLYEAGAKNILFMLEQLKQHNLSINLEQFILSGHSNGGDIAKYFANKYPQYVKSLILFDARRAKLLPQKFLSVLMFEADDTTTDAEVIAIPNRENNKMRDNLDLTIIKPSGAFHMSYTDDKITDNLKTKIYSSLNWFLNF